MLEASITTVLGSEAVEEVSMERGKAGFSGCGQSGGVRRGVLG